MAAFASATGSSGGMAAAVLMGLNGLVQLLGSLVITLTAMIGLGGVSYLAIGYTGTATSTEEEVVVAATAAAIILIASLIPLTSALAGLYAAWSLVEGGMVGRTMAACAVSVVGPMFWVVAAAPLVVVDPLVAVITSSLGVAGVLASLLTAAAAVWAVRAAPPRNVE